MIKLFLIFLLPLSLYASKILSYNIYDRTERVDVMITFDTPYEGVIKQSSSDSNILIKLEDASIESAKVKKLSSKYIKSITITPMSGYTQISANVPPSVALQASKTSDSYGLRLRFTAAAQAPKSVKEPLQTEAPLLASLPTKKSDDIAQSYYIVITILIIGIIILFYIKKRVSTQPNVKKTSSWLFAENNNNNTKEAAKMKQPSIQNGDVTIRFQKSLDEQNSVVMLDFGEQSYLVLMGKNNILLDRFTHNRPTTQDDFESILQSRHQELDNFLNGGGEDSKEEYLQAYKEKAASVRYEV
ncbi:hypothetical protein [Sulfurimonas sp.]|jgi:hypothetical protein|uniref:hypothetical protein n=1 Tax=Sulfurimonas sp. TaxID=2022749 RepID=UPI002A368440|nr:hypothetical protein [Sulfurimonas sp.]MDY0123711.1 hypothetical protein [Sulfurimonas sp.]